MSLSSKVSSPVSMIPSCLALTLCNLMYNKQIQCKKDLRNQD